VSCVITVLIYNHHLLSTASCVGLFESRQRLPVGKVDKGGKVSSAFPVGKVDKHGKVNKDGKVSAKCY